MTPKITVTVSGEFGNGKSTVAALIVSALRSSFHVEWDHGPDGPNRNAEVSVEMKRQALRDKGLQIKVEERMLHTPGRGRLPVAREELVFGGTNLVDIGSYAPGLTTAGKWFWDCYYGDPAPAKSYVLPTELFILLEGGALYQHAHDQFYTIEYPTEAMATNALRRAFAIAKLTRDNK